jgi:hypothetical protein
MEFRSPLVLAFFRERVSLSEARRLETKSPICLAKMNMADNSCEERNLFLIIGGARALSYIPWGWECLLPLGSGVLWPSVKSFSYGA